MTIITKYYHSPAAELILGDYQGNLCLCDWRYRKMRSQIDTRIQKGLNSEYVEGDSELLNNTIAQLNEYFQKKRTDFEIPILLVGTAFQKQVWEKLRQVEYGSTNTYMQLSEKLNNPKAIRAVSSANGSNAISIIIPCHRIIGSDGKLVGYAGGLKAKQQLLTLEGTSPLGQLSLF